MFYTFRKSMKLQFIYAPVDVENKLSHHSQKANGN